MFDALTLAQLALSAFLLALIVERVIYLFAIAPIGAEGFAFILRALEHGSIDEAKLWASEAARTHVGQVLCAALGSAEPDDAVAEVLFDLSARAGARLRVLRVGATIASTTGLLAGILRLRGLGRPAGLLALEAGLAEKVALGEALAAMALGVATSAVCFYALSMFHVGARDLLVQAGRAARALQCAADVRTASR